MSSPPSDSVKRPGAGAPSTGPQPASEAGSVLEQSVRAKTEEIERREVAYWVFREIAGCFPQGSANCVLDVGGGTGAYLSLLKPRLKVRSFVSTDVVGRTGTSDPGVMYIQVGAEDLTKRIVPGSVDLALMIEVIEHLSDPDRGLEQVHACLRPGGVLILTTPNLSSLLNRAALLLGYLPLSAEVSTRHVFGRPGRVVAGHLRLHTFRSLVEFVSFYGLKVQSSYTVPNSRTLYRSLGRVGTLLYWIDRLSSRLGSGLGSRSIIVARRENSPSLHGGTEQSRI